MSTVMAAIVEFIYTVRAKRQRYLRGYLLDFFDTQLLPSFEQKIVQLATAAPERIRGSSTTSESNRLVGWVISPLLALRGPGKFWQRPTIWAILLVILLSIALIYFTAWTETLIVPAFVFILVYYFWDQHSQDSKLNQGIDQATSEKLGLSPETRKQLDSFRQNFVDEIAKQGTDPENGKNNAERITPTEFASALGRSELGEMLVQTGRDKLDLLITDLLRRFDNTGAMSLAEFKRKSTKLSVFAAFITAFVVNINAISLLAAYFADDDLSARVIALYSEEELAGMAETLNAVENEAYAELVQKQKELNEKQEDLKKIQDAEAKTNSPSDATDLEETIKAAEAEIERLRSEINGTVATLTAIGTPIGWGYFPFCLSDESGRRPGVMPSCHGLSSYSAWLAKIEAVYLPVNGKVEQAEKEQLTGGICASARNTAKNRLAAREGYFWIKPAVTVCNHWDTTRRWLDERKHNLFSWLMGVLLAGVLIGLGGPFWFDFYRRLATVTQIARSFGVAQPKQKKSQQDSSSPPKANDPQTKHTPDSAVEAFVEAVEAKRVMTDVPAPGRLLNADGT